MDRSLPGDQAPAESLPPALIPASISTLPEVIFPPPGCCVGADVPGVGYVHAEDCSRSHDGFDLHLSADDVLELRQADRHDREREGLIAQLLFAARALAEKGIVHTAETSVGRMPGWCRECQMSDAGGALEHGTDCRVGRVLSILAALETTVNPIPDQRKEAATEQEACAGDGIRPRELHELRMGDEPMPIDLLCMRCGERGGEWFRAEKVADRSVALGRLTQRERIALDAGNTGIYVYIHNCADTRNCPGVAESKGGAQ